MALGVVLGVDAGLSEVKVVGMKGQIKFPSVVKTRSKKDRSFKGPLSFAEQHKDKRFELSIGRDSYYLGDHAIFAAGNTGEYIDAGGDGTGSKNDEEAFVRAIGGVCAYLGSYETYQDKDIYVYMTFGTPINSSLSDEEIEEIEDRFYNDGSPFEVEYNGATLNIHIKKILVLPEGAAAYYAKESYPDEDVYILDPGSHTVNITHLHQGAPDVNSSTNLELGVTRYKEIYEEDAARIISKQSLKMMRNKLKWPKGSHVFICGGFAQQVHTEFEDVSEGIFTSEILIPEIPVPGSRTTVKQLDPIFANAAGMYFIATQAFAEYLNVLKPKKVRG